MTAAKLRSPTDAARLMRAVGTVLSDKGACVLKDELSDYCDREGIRPLPVTINSPGAISAASVLLRGAFLGYSVSSWRRFCKGWLCGL